MAKLVVLPLICLVALGAFAEDESTGNADTRHGMMAGIGAGLSLGHVELHDGADSLIDGEVGFAVNGNLGFYLSPQWALQLSVRTFSQTDQGLFDLFPTLCVVIGPAVTWFMRPQARSPLVTLGLGYPFDGLDSVDATGAFGAFLGLGYQSRRRLRAELNALVGIYDSGMTLAVTLTANLIFG